MLSNPKSSIVSRMSIIISTSLAALLLFILTSVDPTLDFNIIGSFMLLFIVGFLCHGRNFQTSFHLYCIFTFSITLLPTLDIHLTNKHIFCPFIFLCIPASWVSCRFLPPTTTVYFLLNHSSFAC